ncbi:hypothetical protein TrVE_jg7214 [Triparma verrucosa]|uniref:Uncharacterized protein n=1 Tax=Triparma verrucosa TaxID=1606542 RepID=A0A9W7C1E3_9STRA|nr:hypothetical protein TrVE_jg7214 [Triparma verrucosa]
MNTLELLVICLVAFASLVGGTVENANNQTVLFNLISNGRGNFLSPGVTTGNNIVDNVDSVILGVGTFSGSPYADSNRVYAIDRIYFSLVCSGTDHSCVLDGLGRRQIMTCSPIPIILIPFPDPRFPFRSAPTRSKSGSKSKKSGSKSKKSGSKSKKSGSKSKKSGSKSKKSGSKT